MAQHSKDSLKDLFGDSDDEEEIAPVKKVGDITGLFGSDSSSDEKDDDGSKKGKAGKASRKKADVNKRSRDSDEYDSEPDAKKTKEDDDFIDKEDDLAGILGEYDNELQRFKDDRPEGHGLGSGEYQDEEEDNFFDTTLKSMKSSRRRNKLALSARELESLVQEILYRMDQAWAADEAASAAGKPGLEKIKMLDKIVATLSKVQMQSTLLDFNLLELMKRWIQPTSRGTLPNVGIRTKLLEVSKKLPVYKDHLKRSGYGKVVMALWKHPQETEQNKIVCRELIERWSRNVFDKSMDYRKLAEYEMEKQANLPKRKEVTRKDESNVEQETTVRVQIPQPMKLDFTYRPRGVGGDVQREGAPVVASKRVNPESRKGRLLKRMQDISRPKRKNVRAINMSIEGRKTK